MQIAVLTSQHFITGTVEVHEQRLSDFLSNMLATTVRLSGTTVGRLTRPTEVLARPAEAHVPATEITVAFERSNPTAPRRGAIVRKHAHPIFLISGAVEIQGWIHSLGLGAPDIHEMLTTLGDRFLPVTQAEMRVAATIQPLSLPAVMVNVRRVTYMATGTGAPNGVD